MNRRRPILLILLLAYVFSPSLTAWIFDASGAWYRPFIIWLAVIAVAYVVQDRSSAPTRASRGPASGDQTDDI